MHKARSIQKDDIFELFFHQSRDLVCIAGFDGYFKIINPAFVNVLGYSEEELLNRPFVEFTHPDDVEKTTNEVNLMVSRGTSTIQFENRYLTKTGQLVYLQWNSSLDIENQTIFAIARDVTEKKLIEEKLERSEKLLNAAQAMVNMGSWSFNPDNHELFWTPELFNIFEIDPNSENVYEEYISRFSEEDFILLNKLVQLAIEQGIPYTIEHQVFLPDGRIKEVKGKGFPYTNEMGKVIRIDGVAQDITESKNAELTILENVKEKEILLKEIHHRVKNNLQVISSLMNLQSNMINNEEIKIIFQDSQQRIKSMASIHDLLYKSTDLADINFSEYITNLINDLVLSYRGTGHGIHLSIDLPKKQLFQLDIAIPLGLLVNEIITNSLKYGVQCKSDPRIEFKLKLGGQKKYLLSISDNGPGFNPKEINKDTLGLMLIESLANQLDGNITLSSGPDGTYYTLEF